MKDYKKILEGVVNIINTAEKSDIGFANICTYIGENCPELKESEDDRMIQYFKYLAPFDKADELYEKYGFYHKDAIAWLEKQCEQKIKTPEESLGIDSETYNKIVDECIYDEQKPIDKVEPNFKVGDWVATSYGKVNQVVSVDKYGDGYTLNDGVYFSGSWCDMYHLWTIQDAKDGDVLAWDDIKCIALFKNIYDEDSFNSYGFVGGCTGTFESRQSYHDIEGAHPATKEQRDTLMKAMADAGYAFDFEKKELKEIENEEYDGDDYGIDSLWHAIHILKKTLGKVDGYQSDDGILEHKCAISAVDKLYKHEPAWCAEDTFMVQRICKYLDAAKKYYVDSSEVRECIDWLKSIKERYTWKPSEEQIESLKQAKTDAFGKPYFNALASLYINLKGY